MKTKAIRGDEIAGTTMSKQAHYELCQEALEIEQDDEMDDDERLAFYRKGALKLLAARRQTDATTFALLALSTQLYDLKGINTDLHDINLGIGNIESELG